MTIQGKIYKAKKIKRINPTYIDPLHSKLISQWHFIIILKNQVYQPKKIISLKIMFITISFLFKEFAAYQTNLDTHIGHKEKIKFVAYSPQLILPQKLAMCDINIIVSIFYGQPNSARSNMQLTNGDT
jgi:hypothetical protein